MSAQTNPRLAYLDAVRCGALLLGIVFHASLSFMPVFIGWAVMDISTSPLVSAFVLISHAFRMELFFLIAGYFSRLKCRKAGATVFMTSRIIRLGIPFVIGWLILKPLLVSGWIMGAESMRSDVNVLNGLRNGFLNVVSHPQDLFSGSHLWFLYYLLMISLVATLLCYCIGRFHILASLVTSVTSKMKCAFGGNPFGWLLLIACSGICLWFMPAWSVDTPDKGLLPNLPVLLLYGQCFFFGWLMQKYASILDRFTELSWHKVVLCIAVTGGALALAQYEIQTGHPWYLKLKLVYTLCYVMMMWLLMSLTLGVGKRCFATGNAVIRYLADASYWLYLIHLPIVIWWQIAVAELSWWWPLKLISVVFLTLAVSLVMYELVVKRRLIGRVLNGTFDKQKLAQSEQKDEIKV